MLLDRGATVDATVNNSATPLLMAAWNGHINVVRKLIECKANVSHKTTWGTTSHQYDIVATAEWTTENRVPHALAMQE